MVALLLAAAVIAGAGSVDLPCDAGCEGQRASAMLVAGDTRAAVAALRDAVSRCPGDRSLTLLLVRAYLLEDNLFWAERTLSEAVGRWPGDAELTAWLAAVHLRQGDPQLARADLGGVDTAVPDPLGARFSLLETYLSRLEGNAEAAAAALARVPRDATLYPEDRPLWRHLQASTQRWWSEALSGRLELGLGQTSNALAGAPTDPGVEGGASSLGQLDLDARLALPAARVAPFLDLSVSTDALGADEYQDLSSLEAAARAGATVLTSGTRLSVGYRAEALYLNQDERLYSEAHRAELELEGADAWVLFGGAGRRSYRDHERSRWEADLGVGGPLPALGRLTLLGGVTARAAAAESPAYDQRGLAAVVAARLACGRGCSARVAVSASWDDYPHSGGALGQQEFGTEERRRDLLGRVTVSVWGPSWHHLRPGVELRLSDRHSTADEAPGFDFSYRERRFLALLRWSFAADPWAPPAAAEPGHVPLEWGLEEGPGGDDDIMELLRQDEDLRRGSSCSLP